MSDRVIEGLVAWAERTPEIRALILTGSRAGRDGLVDEGSDYDVIVAATGPERFAAHTAWQAELGTRLVGWGDEDEIRGHRTWFRGVIYEDHTRIDYTFWPDALLAAIADGDTLPPELDLGYRVLLDKDRGTAGWPAPTFTAHVLTPPTEAEYRALVEEFWWNMSYLPKAIRRGDLFFLDSWMIEHDQKIVCLRRMLEWRIGALRGWTFAPGPYGRGLERHLDESTRSALAATYAGLDADAIWHAAMRLADLFRDVATDVASALGYRYPDDIDARMVDHLRRNQDR